jgi:hypothetical protein
MRNPRRRPASTRRFIWLLSLLLLIPAAQAAATWHDVSVAPFAGRHAEHGRDTGQKRLHDPAHCDLCLTAAALAGGALPLMSPDALPALGRHETPCVEATHGQPGLRAQAYRSRAPPLASR